MQQIKFNLRFLGLLFLSVFFSIASYDFKAIAETKLIPALDLHDKIRIENVSSNNPTLPPEVQSAVFEDTVKRTSKTVDALRVVEAEPQNWTDGCLGLAKPEEICTQAIVPGWRAIVTDGSREWTYRTNNSGSLVKLEQSPSGEPISD